MVGVGTCPRRDTSPRSMPARAIGSPGTPSALAVAYTASVRWCPLRTVTEARRSPARLRVLVFRRSLGGGAGSMPSPRPCRTALLTTADQPCNVGPISRKERGGGGGSWMGRRTRWQAAISPRGEARSDAATRIAIRYAVTKPPVQRRFFALPAFARGMSAPRWRITSPASTCAWRAASSGSIPSRRAAR